MAFTKRPMIDVHKDTANGRVKIGQTPTIHIIQTTDVNAFIGGCRELAEAMSVSKMVTYINGQMDIQFRAKFKADLKAAEKDTVESLDAEIKRLELRRDAKVASEAN